MKRTSVIFLTFLLILTMVPSFNVFAAAGDVTHPTVVAANDWYGNPSWQSATLTESATAGTYTIVNNDAGAGYGFTWVPATGTLSAATGIIASMVVPGSIGGVNVTALGLSTTSTGTFQGNTALKYLVVSENVTTLGSKTFKDNSANFVGIKLPSTLTTIMDNAFINCRKLPSIDLMHSNITSLGDTCFKQCYALTSITIPATVTNIPKQAFYNCYMLNTIIFTGPVVITNNGTAIGASDTTNGPFYDTGALANIVFKSSSQGSSKIAAFALAGKSSAGVAIQTTVFYPQGATACDTSAFQSSFKAGTLFTAVSATTTNSAITSFTSTANGYNVQTNIGLTQGIPTSKNYIALYDANENLIAIQSIPSGVKSIDFVTSDTTVTKARVFVWDSIASLKPLCGSQTVTKS